MAKGVVLVDMVDYLKSVLKEILPAWIMRKAVDVVDVRPVEQPSIRIRDLVGAAPSRRYRGSVRSEVNDNRVHAALPPGRLPR